MISGQKNKVAEHLIIALEATSSESSYEAVRGMVSSRGYVDLYNRYKRLTEAKQEVIRSLVWLMDTDPLYLERVFTGLFLNEPVEVSKEGKSTVIKAVAQTE